MKEITDIEYEYQNNCNFLMKCRNKTVCGIFKEFYNFPKKKMCDNCPFYKTKEEYMRGIDNVKH